MNNIMIGVMVLAAMLAGALAGMKVGRRLPEDHLTDETRNLVSVSMAMVATITALVLGLLISNANSSFTRLGADVTDLSAKILRLDHILSRYGPDAAPARATLLQYAEHKASDLFPDESGDVRLGNPVTYDLLQGVEEKILSVKPASPRDEWWLSQAMTIAGKIGDTRWLLAQQVGQGTPKTFVALLVFWLTLLFASFGLFAPRNLTCTVTLTLCALAVAGAVTMILELEHGVGGLIRISPEPMQHAVQLLRTDQGNMYAGP
jgi:hypothetical protein